MRLTHRELLVSGKLGRVLGVGSLWYRRGFFGIGILCGGARVGLLAVTGMADSVDNLQGWGKLHFSRPPKVLNFGPPNLGGCPKMFGS